MRDGFMENEDMMIEAPKEEREYSAPEDEEVNETPSDEYYALPVGTSRRNMIWSVVSLVAGILSVISCPLYPLGIILSAVSVAASLYSRSRLGYFDRTSLFGLIGGIFGAVFSVASMIVSLSGIFNNLA